eukprot:8118382-Alexandrium_andersonii.AAC.1
MPPELALAVAPTTFPLLEEPPLTLTLRKHPTLEAMKYGSGILLLNRRGLLVQRATRSSAVASSAARWT